jgi:hypothetical protein
MRPVKDGMCIVVKIAAKNAKDREEKESLMTYRPGRGLIHQTRKMNRLCACTGLDKSSPYIEQDQYFHRLRARFAL